MHTFELSEEQTMILDTVGRLVEEVARPKALEHDEHHEFARAGFDGLAELGLFGVAVGEASGGAGLGMLAFVVAAEALGRGCGSTARAFVTQAGAVARALDLLDDGAELLEAAMTGAAVVAWVGGEAGLTAATAGDGFTVTGRHALVPLARVADRFLVAARIADEPALFAIAADAVERDDAGALGFRAAAPGRVGFRASAAEPIARGAAAKAAIARAELALLLGSAALATGQAFESTELARRHSVERIAFGKPLLRQQSVGHKLVESRRRAEAARHLTWHAARLCDGGDDEAGLATARLARLTAVDAAIHAADEAIQVHGGYGFTVEYHVERHYRDAQTLAVLDGGLDRLRDALVPARA